ncbi:hypothetical protein ZWY2020_032760 [Hordeum vulgare]|nr:hypothetical protein ZWY2020_032760 [Hordeum vulgare]
MLQLLLQQTKADRGLTRGGAMAATAGAAAEIVREITARRHDCRRHESAGLRLARKVSLLTHLVAEVAEAAGEDGAAEPEATAWVADLLRALRIEGGPRTN